MRRTLLWGLIAGQVVLTGHSLARDDGRYQNSPLKSWVTGLTNKQGVNCCDSADGFPAEAENDTVAGHWRVKIEGDWWVVPDDALIDNKPNKLGYPMVWWYPEYELDGKLHPHIRCFIPGALL